MKDYKICVYAICKNEEKFVDRFMDCLEEIKVTHSPRFIINMEMDQGKDIFSKMDMSYNEFKRELTEEELYAQLIKHTRTLDYSRTIQGNGLLYLKEEKIIKKIKY